MTTVLSHEEARRAYDRIGSLQDSQAFYEDRATRLLLDHADLGSARSVFEFGCGTGRFAQRLLAEFLPSGARYRGVDISPRMVSLAEERLAPWSERAEVALSDGDAPVEEPSESYDRFVSNYVFDLLSEQDIAGVLREAHRMLAPGGLLCLTGLSTGRGPLSRTVSRLWTRIHALRPALVGGCRPLDLLEQLPGDRWSVRHHQRVSPLGVTSEVVVAARV